MITFIIPTLKRNTLQRAIDSLLQQTNKNWKAIVVFDGVDPVEYKHPQIKTIKIPKTGKVNYAGEVRNVGIKAADTEWIGFLDDDDTISKDYVSRFEEEIKLTPDAKCIIFRMKNYVSIPQILPLPQDDNFYEAKVGISFAMKKDLGLLFKASAIEDFRLLEAIRKGRNKMVISPYVTYFVRNSPTQIGNFKRIIIN